MNDQTIRNWLKSDEDKKDPENSRISELEAQLKEEKRKTSDLQQTVDILKKSVAKNSLYFHKKAQLCVFS